MKKLLVFVFALALLGSCDDGDKEDGKKSLCDCIKTIIEKSIGEYAKILRKAQYTIIKDWMSKAKAGVLDFYDINRGIKTNPWPWE